MPTRKRARASARKASRRRAPSTPKPRRNAATEYKRVTPWGTITVRSGRPLGYTPELKAHARYRFEETPESAYSIAADLGMHHTSLKRLIKREGWVRRNPPPVRDITPVMRIAAAVDAMTSATQAPPTPDPSPPLASLAGGGELADTSTVDRLEAAVLKELAAVELMRANLGSEPLRPLEAQVTARTLSVLTETLAKLRRLRLRSAPQSGPPDHDDDMPADIDAFRLDLARRIDAFVASRTNGGDAVRDAAPAPLDEPR
jgi:hypothetical protein